MSEEAENTELNEPIRRCPGCDSVVAADASRCLMCGVYVPAPAEPEEDVKPEPEMDAVEETAVPPPSPAPKPEPAPEPTAVADPKPEAAPVFQSKMREKQSPAALLLTLFFAVLIFILGALVLRYRDPNLTVALVPTVTPIPPTPTHTPTWTPLPTETSPPTAVPTETPIPPPTDTPSPPRSHQVAAGETLFGLAVQYRISVESIAAANSFDPAAPLQQGQSLQIPWPTPTPPLEPVAVDINGETVIADPQGCERYQIQSGDSISAIAARYNIDFELFMRVNRLDDQSVIQPGDTLCIPEVIVGGQLPPTPGPSPTASSTPLPPGPYLLYPTNEATVEPPDGVLTLQWTAVKDLAPDEWYMIEVTDISDVDGLPFRGFTRDNAFRVPTSWRPPAPETHRFRWRVSLVQVTGERSDGQFIYTYGGESSQDAYFNWLGAVPTPTPTPTLTPTPTPALNE